MTKTKYWGRKAVVWLLSLSLALGATTGCTKKKGLNSDISATDVNSDEVILKHGEVWIRDVDFTSTPVSVEFGDNDIVFYQIFVGSFSDSNGDGIGDLRGIINRFDYLNDGDPQSGTSLGIEGIWLSPIFKSPSYHKYDTADYYTIDPKFGTMEDLKDLVKLCHERGVKLILDVAFNHTSTYHPWFVDFKNSRATGDTENAYYDFYTCVDTKVNGRTFNKIAGTDSYYECNFSGDMPELNFDNPAVRQAVLDVCTYYLTEIGLDGFRFDAAKYMYFGDDPQNIEFWNWFMDELLAVKPDLYAVGEVWEADGTVKRYSEALSCFDFTMSQAEGKVASTAQKGDVNAYTAYIQQFNEDVKAMNENSRLVAFIANHDMDRAAGYLTPGNGFAQMAANLYLLGPGSSVIYYGEEIAMRGTRGGANTDANRRLAMLWGDGDTIRDPEGTTFKDSDQTNGTVAEQLSDPDSLYNYYKRVLMVRKANPEIANGTYTALNIPDTKAGGFLSTYEGSTVAVIHNTTLKPVTIDLSKVTDINFSKICAVLGVDHEEFDEESMLIITTFAGATLEGAILTITPQTSVILR